MDVESKADHFVGIAVSKARVDVHVRLEGSAFGCATDPEGLGTLVARLQPLSPPLVALEASGGHEGAVAAALVQAADHPQRHAPRSCGRPRGDLLGGLRELSRATRSRLPSR